MPLLLWRTCSHVTCTPPNIHIKSLQQAQDCASIAAGSCRCIINRLCSSFPQLPAQQQHAGHCTDDADPGLEAVTPAELKQILPDIQKVLAVLLQRPWEPQPPSLRGRASCGVQPEAPGLLARLQCRILQSAIGKQEHDGRLTFAAVLQMFTSGVADTVGSSSSSSTALQTQPVQSLAGFRSMTVQTRASLEGFIRDSAQQLAASSMQDSRVAIAVEAINAALISIPHSKPGPLLSLAVAAAPGSPEQQQLYSLLSSLIKLSALGVDSSDAALAQTLSFSCLISACAAIKLLELAQDSEGCSSAASSTATQHSTGPPTASGSSTVPATDTIALLPSLVLVGRSCMVWAQLLQQGVPQLLQLHEERSSGPPLEFFEKCKLLTSMPGAPVLILLCLQPDPQVSDLLGSFPAITGLQNAFTVTVTVTWFRT